MTIWQEYHLANSIQDALQALNAAPGSALILAGGTDLLLDLQQGRHPPVQRLVDVTAVPELTCLEIRQSELFVGAAVPLNHIVRHPLVQQHAQALVEASDLIGGPQVRNTATLGGNVGHALPAADGTIALLALDAQAEIASRSGLRRQPLSELFLGPGKSALTGGQELLVGFYLPLRSANEASAFRRVMRPQGVALPIINLAVWLRRQGDLIQDVRIAVGPSGPVPRRVTSTEALLCGQPFSLETQQRAQALLRETTQFRSSPHRASAAYRRLLVQSLLADTLSAAWERASYDE
jgi:CO/xanthine dehydrogenase FAD-binding subunit